MLISLCSIGKGRHEGDDCLIAYNKSAMRKLLIYNEKNVHIKNI